MIILQKVTNFLKEQPDELEKYWKQKKVLVKLPEARQLVTNRPKKARLVRDKAVESPVWAEKPVEAKKGPRGRRRWWYVRGERICWRSAGGLLEVCRRSAGGLPKGVGACGKTPPMEVCRRSAEWCVGA